MDEEEDFYIMEYKKERRYPIFSVPTSSYACGFLLLGIRCACFYVNFIVNSSQKNLNKSFNNK